MAFLTVAGIDLPTGDLQENEPIFIGDESRSASGALRADIEAIKRRWTATWVEIANATYENLFAAVAMGQHVSVTGDALPGVPRTMRVKLTSGEYVKNRASWVRDVNAVLEDV